MYEFETMTGQEIIQLVDAQGVKNLSLNNEEAIESMADNPDVLLWNSQRKDLLDDLVVNEKLFNILTKFEYELLTPQDKAGMLDYINYLLKQEGLKVRVVDIAAYNGGLAMHTFQIVVGDGL